MYCKFTRLGVLTAAFAIATVVFPSVYAQDKEPERASVTAHCRELRQRRHEEAKRLRARQQDELAKCGPAARTLKKTKRTRTSNSRPSKK
jgi:hypothetical protein